MRYSPHDYQLYAIRYIKEHPICSGICQIHSVRGSDQHLRSAWQASDYRRRDHFPICADEPAVPEKCKPYLVRDLRHRKTELH